MISRLLQDAELANLRSTYWGSNGVFVVDLCVGGRVAGKAVYKPMAGEAPLWDFPSGTLYLREYAAYLVAQAFGWSFVPCTVIRDGPYGIGSVQQFVDHDEKQRFNDLRANHLAALRCIAAFDCLTNNADRKSAHLLLGSDGAVYGIDHGLTFHCDPKQRTVLSEFHGCDVDPGILHAIRRVRSDGGAVGRLRSRLGELLAANEVKTFFKRVESVADKGSLPDARRSWYGYW